MPAFPSLTLRELMLLEQERLRSQILEQYESTAKSRESVGLLKLAIQSWREALRVEPLYEGAYREIVRLYLQLGDQTMALKTYLELEEVLGQSFSPPARPTSKTRRLLESVPTLRYALQSGMPLPA